MKKLAKFNVTEAQEGFSLHIEDEAGQVLELSATRDQVDLIADKLDELLSQDDSADEIAGEDDEDDEDQDGEDDEDDAFHDEEEGEEAKGEPAGDHKR